MALPFAQSDGELTPRIAFKRAEKILRQAFRKVQRMSENDWMFAQGAETPCLLTMWGYRAPNFEHHIYESPVDGLVWDAAWCMRKRGLSEGALVLAKSAAGRGAVEMHKGDFFSPGEIFFYDRMLTVLDFGEEEAAKFVGACAEAVARIDKALKQG